MNVKVFIPNKNGKIEFTQNELEQLLNEVYDDGYQKGSSNYLTMPITYPSVDPPNPITHPWVTYGTSGNNYTDGVVSNNEIPGQESLF